MISNIILGLWVWLFGTFFFMVLTHKWAAENKRKGNGHLKHGFSFLSAAIWPIMVPIGIVLMPYEVYQERKREKFRLERIAYLEAKEKEQ